MHRFASLFLFIFICCGNSNAQDTDGKILISNAHIVDVVKGGLKKADAILVNGGNIEKIGYTKDISKSKGIGQRIDAGGGYILPGLWDMHIHLEGTELVEDNKALLPVFLAYGITTVRDCASNLGEQVLRWRDEINAGTLTGPRIFTAGRKLEGKNSIWEDDLEIANEAELNQMLDLLDRYRVDFVKITENTLSGDLFIKSVKAAHARGYRVSGHIPYDASIHELVDAGLTSIEHASYMLRLGSDEEKIKEAILKGSLTKADAEHDYLLHFDQSRATGAYKDLARKGVFLCPTLIGGRQLAYLDSTDHSNDAFLQYLTEKFKSKYAWRINRMSGETAEQKQQRKERYQLIKNQLPYIQQAGIRIIAGSDAAALNTYVYPAESLIDELQIFQEAGLAPADILRSATLNGALYFGKEKTMGSLDMGKVSDLVILKENPLENISAIQTVLAVMRKGRYYDRPALDRILQTAAARKKELDQSRK